MAQIYGEVAQKKTFLSGPMMTVQMLDQFQINLKRSCIWINS